MTVLERIKEETRAKKNYGLTKLESELGYGNGSLSKAKNIPAYRINEIAEFLGVSVDYLMTGKEKENAPKFSRDHIELIGMYSKLNEAQKKAVFDLLRSFLNE